MKIKKTLAGLGILVVLAFFATGFQNQFSGPGSSSGVYNATFGQSALTGQVLTATNAASPTWQSPSIGDCNGGAPVTTTPYNIAPDNATTLLDRGTVCRFRSGASVINLPLSTGGGAAGFFIKIINDGANATILTINRTSADVITVCSLSTCADGQTSFVMTQGQWALLTQGASGVWEATIAGLAGISPVTPTINTASDFNTGTMDPNPNVSTTFIVTIGTGTANSVGTVKFGPAAHRWNCFAQNQTRADLVSQTATSSTTCTLTNYGTTFAATNWTNSDVIIVHAWSE